MIIYQAVLTLTHGTPQQVSFTDPQGNPILKCTRLTAEPGDGNSHVAYIGNATMAIGTSTETGVVKRLAPPSGATAIIDMYDTGIQQSHGNVISFNDFYFDGTTSEQVKVSAYVR